ncbi:MAG: hypothetical protein J6Y20_01230 [Lachnospiraceae bacterium]|nr:hypothetical protein [Lachnospiraceae bacterium]
MSGPIYEPMGAAKEYGDLALNIYTGCPHRCFYCFAPGVLRRDKEEFHTRVEPRKNIVEYTRKQLEKERITGKTIHLCFTCDPFPTGYDTTPTLEIIKLLKEYGNHVQILTKGDGGRAFDLLGEGDWYGVTMDGSESSEWFIKTLDRFNQVIATGAKTWVSFEPVLDDKVVLARIAAGAAWYGKIKIGKLNYHPSEIDWKRFGNTAEVLCKGIGLDYYIKDSLRKEMDKD